MAYYSIFDKIQDADPIGTHKGSALMPCLSTLSKVLTELEGDLDLEATDPITLTKIALNASRIVRVAINHKIANESPESIAQVIRAIDFALRIYRGEVSSTQVRTYRINTPERLLKEPAIQKQDNVTWFACTPEKSRETALRIADANQGADILMIALAHGGIIAGMDVYLRYCEITKSSGSTIYGVRFSTQKSKDVVPQISELELEILKRVSRLRAPIIFDEDSASGATMREARKFFAQELGEVPQTEVNCGRGNIDPNKIQKTYRRITSSPAFKKLLEDATKSQVGSKLYPDLQIPKDFLNPVSSQKSREKIKLMTNSKLG